MQPNTTLRTRLMSLSANQPKEWRMTGKEARPGLHGIIRYPAMMVPSMQGDILDAIINVKGHDFLVIDPFVGSGTTMTEALARGLDFTGVDINPLAILVCEAKAEIDRGVDISGSFAKLYTHLLRDSGNLVDVDFPGRDKWFSVEAAVNISRIRRAIQAIQNQTIRKLLWVVLADTIRVSSNSRTSTYKLHIREAGNSPDPNKIIPHFIASVKLLIERERSYRDLLGSRSRKPQAKLICGDLRSAALSKSRTRSNIVITSPPYGDNQTTIPYGQYSYLALQWIDALDLPSDASEIMRRNSHSLDSASLGGKVANAARSDEVMEISQSLRDFRKQADALGKVRETRKVLAFMQDYFDALKKIRPSTSGGTYWVFTTGNRRAAGLTVPFDRINEDFAEYFGGRIIASIQRELPVKRMPAKNSQGEMITAETTMVAEFS